MTILNPEQLAAEDEFMIAHTVNLFSKHCRSPIEKRFLVAMARAHILRCRAHEDRVYVAAPNCRVVIDGLAYLADFCVLFGAYPSDRDGENAYHGLLAVEVDGHEFHERTKEQAAKDRSRDLAMLAAGVLVARFTGAQVYADAEGCAERAFEVVDAWFGVVTPGASVKVTAPGGFDLR